MTPEWGNYDNLSHYKWLYKRHKHRHVNKACAHTHQEWRAREDNGMTFWSRSCWKAGSGRKWVWVHECSLSLRQHDKSLLKSRVYAAAAVCFWHPSCHAQKTQRAPPWSKNIFTCRNPIPRLALIPSLCTLPASSQTQHRFKKLQTCCCDFHKPFIRLLVLTKNVWISFFCVDTENLCNSLN